MHAISPMLYIVYALPVHEQVRIANAHDVFRGMATEPRQTERTTRKSPDGNLMTSPTRTISDHRTIDL